MMMLRVRRWNSMASPADERLSFGHAVASDHLHLWEELFKPRFGVDRHRLSAHSDLTQHRDVVRLYGELVLEHAGHDWYDDDDLRAMLLNGVQGLLRRREFLRWHDDLSASAAVHEQERLADVTRVGSVDDGTVREVRNTACADGAGKQVADGSRTALGGPT